MRYRRAGVAFTKAGMCRALPLGGTLLWVVIGALGLSAAAGCTHVVAQRTPYYRYGPMQPEPPQGDLPEGTRVIVLGKEGSYSRVLASNGLTGYVLSDSLMPAAQWDRLQKATKRPEEALRSAPKGPPGPLAPPPGAPPPQPQSRP
jgi:hypothetical protein